jgi:threonyl-tRNA synthetase
MQVPYMLVVGEREVALGAVSLRQRDGERVNGMTVSEFVTILRQKIETRALEL